MERILDLTKPKTILELLNELNREVETQDRLVRSWCKFCGLDVPGPLKEHECENTRSL